MVVFCVVDASAFFEHVLMSDGDKASDFHNLLPFGEIEKIVPHLFRVEVISGLLRWMRNKKLSRAQFVKCISRLNNLDVHTDIQPAGVFTVELAEKHNLTGYDAVYLELAMTVAKSNSVILATFDKALVKAAQAEGIPLLYQRN